MANIFTLEKFDDFSEQIDIDELYEYKKNNDLNKLALFQKILNRVHVRIKTTSRQKKDEHFCWYVVPEVIIGVPKYDQAECIAYIMDKLKTNGFMVRYFHPNTVLISWEHWIPSYVRTELKKKTGIVVNEYGVKIGEEDIKTNGQGLNQGQGQNQNALKKITQPQNPNDFLLNLKDPQMDGQNAKPQKKFTPIDSYKPTGNLFYNDT
jgi:hypothetical protein